MSSQHLPAQSPVPTAPNVNGSTLDDSEDTSDGKIVITTMQHGMTESSTLDFEAFMALMSYIAFTITEIDMSGVMIRAKGAIIFAQMLKMCAGLKILNLEGNRIGADGAGALAGALEGCMSLQSLNLCNNCIGPKQVTRLIKKPKAWRSLKILYLDGNDIACGGATDMARALGQPNLHAELGEVTLKELGLGLNNIGDEGIESVAGVIRIFHMLQCLNLSCNSITCAGVQPLAKELLQGCPVLEELDLEQNNIGDEGARGLAEVLVTYTTLVKLKVRMNQIKDPGRASLEAVKKIRPSLRIVW